MSPQMKWGIAGVIIALILFGFIPWYIPVILLVVALAVRGRAGARCRHRNDVGSASCGGAGS